MLHPRRRTSHDFTPSEPSTWARCTSRGRGSSQRTHRRRQFQPTRGRSSRPSGRRFRLFLCAIRSRPTRYVRRKYRDLRRTDDRSLRSRHSEQFISRWNVHWWMQLIERHRRRNSVGRGLDHLRYPHCWLARSPVTEQVYLTGIGRWADAYLCCSSQVFRVLVVGR